MFYWLSWRLLKVDEEEEEDRGEYDEAHPVLHLDQSLPAAQLGRLVSWTRYNLSI